MNLSDRVPFFLSRLAVLKHVIEIGSVFVCPSVRPSHTGTHKKLSVVSLNSTIHPAQSPIISYLILRL